MLLYLLRHGDAVESNSDDVSRLLSALGEEQAMHVASAFAALHLPLEYVLSSPLLRAKQMAEIICKVLGDIEHSTTEYRIPGTNERQLFRQITKIGKQAVLLVGHEPHLRTVASMFISGSRHTRIELKKGTLLCIETVVPAQADTGEFKWMMTIDQMKQLRSV